MIERIKYNRLLISSIVVLVALVIGYSIAEKRSEPNISIINQRFLKQEQILNAYLSENIVNFQTGNRKKIVENAISFHVYRNDSLVFWNTNSVPVYRSADLHFPVAGLVHLQNGWYYSSMKKINSEIFVASFLISREFPYENAQLINGINPEISNSDLLLTTEIIPNRVIKNNKGQALFSFIKSPKNNVNKVLTTWLFLFTLLLLFFIWRLLFKAFQHAYTGVILGVIFILLRYLCFHFNWLDAFSSSALFDPTLLAISEWIPNFGELITTCLLGLILLLTFQHYITLIESKTIQNRFIIGISLLLFPVILYQLRTVACGMIVHSSIPMQLHHYFLLNGYSFALLGLLVIGAIHSFIALHQLLLGAKKLEFKTYTLFLLWIIGSTIGWLLSSDVNYNLLEHSFPSLLGMVVIYWNQQTKFSLNFNWILVGLLLFSFTSVTSISFVAEAKEHSERELYANQLADDSDISTELAYQQAQTVLCSEKYLERLLVPADEPSVSALKEALERRVFNGFWERYDIDFYYFPIKDSNRVYNSIDQTELDDLIHHHGNQSELATTLFRVKDYESQYNYIFRELLNLPKGQCWLYGTLKSKRIPEEIGFPRLLISNKANVFESLENYSIAKYHDGQLVTAHGSFVYPYRQQALVRKKTWINQFFDKDGYNHYGYQHSKKDLIILSQSSTTWVDFLTNLAFILVFSGFIIGLLYFLYNRVSWSELTFTLATKIQLVLIALIVLSMVALSLGSGTFLTSQYKRNTYNLLQEKLRSLKGAPDLKWETTAAIYQSLKSNELDYLLSNWAKAVVTDINIYDNRGMLIGSSQPKLYNKGIVGEQIHPEAYQQLVSNKLSSYIHDEKIGNLSYASAYSPLFNKKGELVAYLNIQHFDQQNALERQIQQYLAAIINVFLVLLAISIVLAIVLSNWLTKPLQLIRKNFSVLELGKANTPIVYSSNDEIGQLVRAYNSKISELSEMVQQLAQSEREMAWREMAKQVAHEIKNPITPIKLSLQHLQRAFDPQAPDAKLKIDRVAQSIIEQIDALTAIANAFSQFSKMPTPNFESVDLIELLTSAITLHEQDAEINLFTDLTSASINADKDMILRVITNLITNSIQAMPLDVRSKLDITLRKHKHTFVLEIQDNGSGIEERALNRIFEPYFTTKSTGTGLGLAMVKQLIDVHGGEIKVISTNSLGTRIGISFLAQ